MRGIAGDVRRGTLVALAQREPEPDRVADAVPVCRQSNRGRFIEHGDGKEPGSDRMELPCCADTMEARALSIGGQYGNDKRIG